MGQTANFPEWMQVYPGISLPEGLTVETAWSAVLIALLQFFATGARSGQSGQMARCAAARSSCSRISWTISAIAEAPSPNARSTIRASPRMSRVMLKADACHLRSARITSKPLIVA